MNTWIYLILAKDELNYFEGDKDNLTLLDVTCYYKLELFVLVTMFRGKTLARSELQSLIHNQSFHLHLVFPDHIVSSAEACLEDLGY